MTILTYQEFLDHLEGQKVYHYKVEEPDREYPRLKWNVHGLPHLNLILVTASCRANFVAAYDESFLLVPAIIDRSEIIDMADVTLADRISQSIWDDYKAELLSGG